MAVQKPSMGRRTTGCSRTLLLSALVVVALVGARPLPAQAPFDAAAILGGSGNDRVFGISVDSAGNAYVVGETFSADFPVVGGIQPNLNGLLDAFVAKVDSDGQLLYSTYLGGSGFDSARSVAVDAAGNAYVVGYTSSTDFPRQNALDANRSGLGDAFITKLGPQGDVVLFSTYFGGNDEDNADAVALDAQGNLYVAGRTRGGLTTINAAQPLYGGNEDAFVLKLNAPLDAYAYVSYLGGGQLEFANAIGVDPSGRACVAGFSGSIDFPRVNASQPAPVTLSTTDGFYALFDATGGTLLVSSLLGGDGFDTARGIACNATHIAVVGDTDAIDFPTGSSTGSPVQSQLAGDKDAFLTVLENPNGNRIYASLKGGRRNDSFAYVAFTSQDVIRVFGDSISSDLPDAGGAPLGQTGAGLFRSSDGGVTWQAVGLQGIAINDFLAVPTTPRTLLAATDLGLHVSTNDGASWVVPSGNLPARVAHTVVADPANPCTWIIGVDADPVDGATTPVGAARTTNCGADWLPWGLPAFRFKSLNRLVDPNRIVATVDRFSTDGNGSQKDTCVVDAEGARVRCFNRGTSDDVIAVDPSDSCRWIEGGGFGDSVLQTSGNAFGCDHPFAGSNTNAAFGQPATALAVVPADGARPRQFFAGTGDGRVFVRSDATPGSWSQISVSFDAPIRAIRQVDQDHVLVSAGQVALQVDRDGSAPVELAGNTGAAGFGDCEIVDAAVYCSAARSGDLCTGEFSVSDNLDFDLSTTGGTCLEEAAAAADCDGTQCDFYLAATVPGTCGVEATADVYGVSLARANIFAVLYESLDELFENGFESQ